MAYDGSTIPNTGTDTGNDLTRDLALDVLQSFERKVRYANIIMTQDEGEGYSSRTFIVEGKEDTTNSALTEYAGGSRVNVSNGTQDELNIPLDRPQYESRRIDKWDQAVARYDTLAMNVRQLGKRLANAVERKISAAIEASSLATGLVANGDGTVIVNVALPGGASEGTTAEAHGNAIAESIYAAIAAMHTNDVEDEEVFVALSPTNYQYLPQSSKAVNTDFTSGNGGFDTGEIKLIGGAMVFETNNMPTTAGLIAQAFTSEAAGMTKLWDVTVDINEQPEYLNAKLINAYFSNGVAALRPQCSVSIKNV